MKIVLKTNFSGFFTLLFIFLELCTIFRALKLLSAWKIEFVCLSSLGSVIQENDTMHFWWTIELLTFKTGPPCILHLC